MFHQTSFSYTNHETNKKQYRRCERFLFYHYHNFTLAIIFKSLIHSMFSSCKRKNEKWIHEVVFYLMACQQQKQKKNNKQLAYILMLLNYEILHSFIRRWSNPFACTYVITLIFLCELLHLRIFFAMIIGFHHHFVT